jgi:tetratricopeptide (TPR) repeat protein
MRVRLLRLLTALRQRPRIVLLVLALFIPIGFAAYLAGLNIWAEIHFRAAQRALDRFDLDGARDHLAVCLRVWPTGARTHFLAAQAARRAGRYDEAEEHLGVCEGLGWPAEAVDLERLLIQGQRGQNTALEELRLRAERGGPEAALILEVLIQDYVETYQLSRALAALNRFLELRPDNIRALLGRGWVWERLLLFGAAADDYRRAVALDPDNDEARRRLAETLVITGPPREALAHFERLEGRADRPELLLGEARCHRQLGEVDRAAELLDRLLARHPDQVAALTERGRLALQAGKPGLAEKLLRRAVRNAPHDREANFTLARCLELRGQKAEARRLRVKCRELDAALKRVDRLTKQVMKAPHNPTLRYEVGMIFLKYGETDQGLRWLEMALREDPGHGPTHRALARHFERAGQTGRAAYHRRFLAGGLATRGPAPAGSSGR